LTATRELVEADLARIATGLGPTQFRAAADRLALLLNQDGDLPDDAERGPAAVFDHRHAGHRWDEPHPRTPGP
jgi:hypothetical protein